MGHGFDAVAVFSFESDADVGIDRIDMPYVAIVNQTINVQVYLKNVGTETANDVKLSLYTEEYTEDERRYVLIKNADRIEKGILKVEVVVRK